MGPLTARISGFTFKKQIMRSHNAIHPLCINHRQAVPLRLPSQQRPHTAITIRRQVSHRHVYPGQYGGIVRTGLPSAILSVRWPVNPNAQLRTRHAKTSANVAYSSFPGNEGACAIHFCPAELHGLFEYLGFHRLFAQKALEFANLLIGGSEFGGRHHFLARCNSRQ